MLRVYKFKNIFCENVLKTYLKEDKKVKLLQMLFILKQFIYRQRQLSSFNSIDKERKIFFTAADFQRSHIFSPLKKD